MWNRYIEKSLCTPTGKGLDSRPSAQAKRFDSSHRHIVIDTAIFLI